MGTYSIKDLEQLSGIKAHTIRIWEKRYGLIAPRRLKSNIRSYSDYDLKKIINVALLNKNGFKISSITKMSDAVLNGKVMELSTTENQSGLLIDRLITCMIDLNEEEFEKSLSLFEKRLGFEQAILEVVYPFLEKIGVLWQTGSITPAHEHFISNLIRQKIIVAISALPVASTAAIRAVLFLPENELHEIGLLFYHFIARKQGFKTFYLGQSLPLGDLKTVCAVHKPHYLITSLTSNPPVARLNDYLQQLSAGFPDITILASGAVLRQTSFRFPPNLKFFETAVQLKQLLRGAR